MVGRRLLLLISLGWYGVLAWASVLDPINSYNNAKHPAFYAERFPRDRYGKNPAMAEARAFFLYPDGTPGLVLGEHNYQVRNHSLEQAKPGYLAFHALRDGRWVPAEVTINYNAQPCIHSRKIVTADFNRDGLPDFALMCQGYDAMPFPGERMRILLSKSSHEYDLNLLHEDVDFFHGGASEDFNGDGLPDLLVGTMGSPRLYINRGKGVFIRDRVFSQIKRAFSIELVDVTGDGKFDIVYGAHEWETPTGVLPNRGDNTFGSFGGIVIPPVPGAGNVFDFVVSRKDGCLYVVRTGGTHYSNRSNWYRGVFVQKYCHQDKTARLIYENKDWVDPTRDYPFTSIRWMVERQGRLTVDWGGFLQVPLD